MSGLTEIRSRLRAALDTLPDTLPVFEVKPERLDPPAVLLVPADPWLAPAPNQPHGIYTVNHQVLILSPKGFNDVVMSEIEERVNLVLDALDSPDHSWMVSEVSAPDDLELSNGTTYLTVRVAVSVPVKLT